MSASHCPLRLQTHGSELVELFLLLLLLSHCSVSQLTLCLLLLLHLPQQQPMAGLRERSSARLQRPWSVYRASTLELSTEMMGLALAGEEDFSHTHTHTCHVT